VGAVQRDLRDLLPAIEPDRHVDDWGRSERVEGFVDRTLLEFLYHLWFRCEVEGVGHVPLEGPALLVANHAGALPAGAWMIAKSIREEHPRTRPVTVAIDRGLAQYPGAGMILAKLGAVAAHPANLHRLLYDERRLVLGFPEAGGGAPRAFRHRYRLRRFDEAPLVEAALLARAPIVPVAVVGAEEAQPAIAPVQLVRRLIGPLALLLATPGYLPAKLRIRFLAPVRTDDMGPAPWRDRGVVRRLSEDLRATLQHELLDLIGQRRSVWLG
jgi:1-acyl-sn-glycerol-3-phosphate acyltransferase